jgi:hypothetical protein
MLMFCTVCLQSVKKRDSETGSSLGKRKSIKASRFAVTHAELLKPIYKFYYYQAMQFATHCHCFPWDATNCKACVQMLLNTARYCHSSKTYTRFKN